MVTVSPKSPNLRGMDISVDFNNMMDHKLGSEHGISVQEIEDLAKRIEKPGDGFHDQFQMMRKKGELGFAKLPYDTEPVHRMKDLAEHVRDRFDNFVLLGIGGSCLGPLAIHQALTPAFYNMLDSGDRSGCPRMFFYDNIDPNTMFSLTHFLDMEKTVFNVVSKSGETTETLAQFLIIYEHLKKILGPKRMRDHLIVTTDPQKGDLRAICNRYDLEGLAIPPEVGGRFSCLSPVGLFPALVSGIDVDGILWGAHAMDQRCQRKNIWENPAYLCAGIQFLADRKRGKNVHVLMIYSDALAAMGEWFSQLWAESLGKKSQGQTPVKAKGATDQHSQLQLYLEGPNNKTLVFLNIMKFLEEYSIPKIPEELTTFPSLQYLGGKTLAKVLHSERMATESALTARHRPNMTIHLPLLCAETLGQLIFLLEMQTAFSGLLYDVNPFDQPAVELGKKMTYHLLGRQGFEEKPSDLVSTQEKDQDFIL